MDARRDGTIDQRDQFGVKLIQGERLRFLFAFEHKTTSLRFGLIKGLAASAVARRGVHNGIGAERPDSGAITRRFPV
jgi:hypothetical protein